MPQLGAASVDGPEVGIECSGLGIAALSQVHLLQGLHRRVDLSTRYLLIEREGSTVLARTILLRDDKRVKTSLVRVFLRAEAQAERMTELWETDKYGVKMQETDTDMTTDTTEVNTIVLNCSRLQLHFEKISMV